MIYCIISDELHMINWAEADFTDILLSGSVASFVVLKMEGENNGLTIAKFNPLSFSGRWMS